MPTSVLGRVSAPRRVVLPKSFHHILDPPDLLLNLPIEHLILKEPQSDSRMCQSRSKPGPC